MVARVLQSTQFAVLPNKFALTVCSLCPSQTQLRIRFPPKLHANITLVDPNNGWDSRRVISRSRPPKAVFVGSMGCKLQGRPSFALSCFGRVVRFVSIRWDMVTKQDCRLGCVLALSCVGRMKQVHTRQKSSYLVLELVWLGGLFVLPTGCVFYSYAPPGCN